jgi:hypothetical protein
MTIRRGEEWGTTVARPVDLVLAGSDAELAALVAADPAGSYGVSGGDIFRSLGSPAPRDPLQRLPMDALEVRLDDREAVLAVAHVVARRGWWRGPLLAVMNADHVGTWNVAPRAHPNDGRADAVEVDAAMSLRHRWQARGRLPQGTHVPHPSIVVRTLTESAWTFLRPAGVQIDGVAHGRAVRVAVRVLPDHFAIHV